MPNPPQAAAKERHERKMKLQRERRQRKREARERAERSRSERTEGTVEDEEMDDDILNEADAWDERDSNGMEEEEGEEFDELSELKTFQPQEEEGRRLRPRAPPVVPNEQRAAKRNDRPASAENAERDATDEVASLYGNFELPPDEEDEPAAGEADDGEADEEKYQEAEVAIANLLKSDVMKGEAMNDDQLTRLIITQIAAEPALWDIHHEDYSNDNQRHRAFTRIQERIAAKGASLPQSTSVRDKFRILKRRFISEHERYGRESTWTLYKPLSFLIPYVEAFSRKKKLGVPVRKRKDDGFSSSAERGFSLSVVGNKRMNGAVQHSNTRSRASSHSTTPTPDSEHPARAAYRIRQTYIFMRVQGTNKPVLCKANDEDFFPPNRTTNSAVDRSKLLPGQIITAYFGYDQVKTACVVEAVGEWDVVLRQLREQIAQEVGGGKKQKQADDFKGSLMDRFFGPEEEKEDQNGGECSSPSSSESLNQQPPAKIARREPPALSHDQIARRFEDLEARVRVLEGRFIPPSTERDL
ncbi:hypothetical protein M3Y99_01939100 [Aphelenchoides fujianensis]|nr:hypothetical protein M3Y99_01939100 [Aphelenchoides fujianensis]